MHDDGERVVVEHLIHHGHPGARAHARFGVDHELPTGEPPTVGGVHTHEIGAAVAVSVSPEVRALVEGAHAVAANGAAVLRFHRSGHGPMMFGDKKVQRVDRQFHAHAAQRPTVGRPRFQLTGETRLLLGGQRENHRTAAGLGLDALFHQGRIAGVDAVEYADQCRALIQRRGVHLGVAEGLVPGVQRHLPARPVVVGVHETAVGLPGSEEVGPGVEAVGVRVAHPERERRAQREPSRQVAAAGETAVHVVGGLAVVEDRRPADVLETTPDALGVEQ